MKNKEMKHLFEKLDPQNRPITCVVETFESGAEDRALELLIEHFRSRTEPIYLFNESDIADFNDPVVIQEADRICDHEILGHRFEGEVDWHFNATEETTKDSEWTWSLARHQFWVTLARAYAMTGDEKYAREFISQLKGFVAAWPVEPHMHQLTANMSYPGDAWRSIEAGIRIYTSWLPVMVYFRKSTSWGGEGWTCFLHAVHDHGEFLYTHYSNHTRCSNWLTIESTALFQLGVMFPEFRRASEWKDLAYRRICHEVRYQFDHCGIHIERTPVYHLVSLLAFFQAFRIAVLNKISVPPYMLPIIIRGTEYLMKLVKPDFSLPMFGDADRNSLIDRKADRSLYEGMNLTTDPKDLNEVRAFFRTMAELTGREDFLYFATGRKEGIPPSNRCFCMPDSGYYIFRTGWEEKDSYFAVTGTQVERGSNAAHSHSDAAHFELQVEGEDVLIDTGRYLYGNCSWLDWWRYFSSSRAHNTIDVDDHRMGEAPETTWEVRGVRTFCHRFETTDEVDLVEVSHNGFAFMPEPVFHLRRVIYFKPAVWLIDDLINGFGKHRFNLCFNFAPGGLEKDKKVEDSYVYLGGRIRVRCVPLARDGLHSKILRGSATPKGGWVSYAYSERAQTPQLIYSRFDDAPVRFLTALIKDSTGSVDVISSKDVIEWELRVKTKIEQERVWSVVLKSENFEVSRIR
jgi:hypothetical protein